MKQRILLGFSAVAVVALAALYIFPACSTGQGMPFGGPEEIDDELRQLFAAVRSEEGS